MERIDRKVFSAIIGAITALVFLLIAFVFFSDFPANHIARKTLKRLPKT